MCLKISNVKLSVKIAELSLSDVENICKTKNLDFKRYNNFIVLRLKGITYIIFKARLLKNSDKSDTRNQHVNITVSDLAKIDESIQKLMVILEQNADLIVSKKIDNITASGCLGKSIDIQKFLSIAEDISKNVSYNPERFPSLFISHGRCKILLFKNGKLVILASRSIKEAEEAFLWISSRCAFI